LIIGAAFLAVMIVGAFASVEVAGGNTEALMSRSRASPVHTHSSTAGTIMQEQLVG
jgi:hypothetical protein